MGIDRSGDHRRWIAPHFLDQIDSRSDRAVASSERHQQVELLGSQRFYDTKFIRSAPGATDADPLAQRKTIGYKFFGKSVIKDQTRLVRLEVASANG
jgi:hypothetical protein